MQTLSWVVRTPKEPMVLEARDEHPGPGEVVVEVAGCGICHTDLGYFYHGVRTRHPLPLTLGHEISGRVVQAGPDAEAWLGRQVVVPAVIPCEECPACRAGRGAVCPHQIFPGNDVHGGFGSHVRVPARGLCPVPDLTDPAINPKQLDLAALSVVADAVSTPYQAVHRTGLGSGDLAVFVGVGGVGGFGVQIAAARGAAVVALDVDEERLASLAGRGSDLSLRPDQLDRKQLRAALRTLAKERDIPTWRTFVFETSGSPAGQQTAFGLLGHGGYLSVVGYTPQKVELPFSHLMALDATVRGNWGCLPEHYPDVVQLVLSGSVEVEPFVSRRPMSSINTTFAELHEGGVRQRIILQPDS